MSATPDVIDAIGGVLPPLLVTLERIGAAQRQLHPPRAAQLADELAPSIETLAAPLRILEETAWPDDLHFMRDRLLDVTRQTIELVRAFVDGVRVTREMIDVFRALRRFARVQETLYPLAPAFEPVSRWFLDPARRDDAALVARLRDAALRDDDDFRTGVLHASNERNMRGGFSLYVPEDADRQARLPLVVALHGGSGHGRDFLWSWLRDARGRGVLVMSPTSRDRTWSLMGEDVDADSLRSMVESVAARYPVDLSRVLLTGMSDGATYAMLAGAYEGMPFTHLAPACGTLHPYLLAGEGLARVAARPIYLIHGGLDWMFPVATARLARDILANAGARLVYREIEDLSHTYPRDENPRILEWLMGDAPA